MNLNKLLDKVLVLYIVSFSITSLIQLLLQCILLTLCNQSQYQDRNVKLEPPMKRMLEFLSTIGQINRANSTTGIFYYSLAFFTSIIFYSIRVVSNGRFSNYFKELGFIAFIKNPELESLNISKKIDACIQAVVNSNFNYGRKFYVRNLRTSMQSNRYFPILEQQQQQQQDYQDHYPSNPNSSASLAQDNFYHTSNLMRQLNLIDHNQNSSSIESLRRQFNYLIKLQMNKTKIWPPNRNNAWARELTKFSLKLYVIVGTFLWIVVQICICHIISNAFTEINNDKLAQDEKEFTFFDRFWSADYHIYGYFGGDFMTTSLTISVTSIVDQLKCLEIFEPKLRKICDTTRKLEHIDSIIRSNPSSRKYLDKIKSSLKIECDQEAIEMYISYLVFKSNIKPSLELAQNGVGQLISLVLGCYMPTLIYYRDVPLHQLATFTCLCIVVGVSINCTFCMCASLYVSCSRVSKLFWSLIAIAEAYNHHQYIAFIEDNLLEVEEDLSLSFDLLNFRNVSGEPIEDSHLNYYSHSLVTPHTIYLIRRLAESDELVVKNFGCKLYGTFDITYNGILKINYLLVTWILYRMIYH